MEECRYVVSLIYTQTKPTIITTLHRVLVTRAISESEALGKAIQQFQKEAEGYGLISNVIIKLQTPNNE